MGWSNWATVVSLSITDASRKNTRPSSNTRTRETLRAWLNCATWISEPSKEERITPIWLAIGLSSLMGFGLPASSCSQRASTKLKLMVSW